MGFLKNAKCANYVLPPLMFGHLNPYFCLAYGLIFEDCLEWISFVELSQVKLICKTILIEQ